MLLTCLGVVGLDSVRLSREKYFSLLEFLYQSSDLLLLISVVLFCTPLDPRWSSSTGLLWLTSRLLFVSKELRLFAWPILFILAINLRSIVFNIMPHPSSSQDAIIFVASLTASLALPIHRRRELVYKLALTILPISIIAFLQSFHFVSFTQLHSSQWTLNLFAGPNQTSYVVGLIGLLNAALFVKSRNSSTRLWLSWFWVVLALGCLFIIWLSGARAAFISFSISCLVIWMIQGKFSRPLLMKRCFFLLLISVIALGVKQLLRPTSYGVPGLDLASDLGRLLIAKCFLSVPFTGSNRFLYGVGVDQINDVCRDDILGGIPDHAHNLFIQIFASSGLVGLLALLIVVYLFFHLVFSSQFNLQYLTKVSSQLIILYVFVQSFLDLSWLHWPISIVLTSILIPFGIERRVSDFSVTDIDR